MKIAVIQGSPKGERSITLQYLKYLEPRLSDCTFEFVPVGHSIRTQELGLDIMNPLLEPIRKIVEAPIS